MHQKTFLALCGATAVVVPALAFASAPAARITRPPAARTAAAGPVVTVRVEGRTRTLLEPRLVHTSSGWITKGGAPVGKCPATSAAGALDDATRHNWSGTFSTSFGDYFITKILGEAQTGKSFYWAIWVNNRFATTGACGIKLRSRDQVLFAVDSVAHHEHPTAIRQVGDATAGRPFTVKAQWFSDGGTANALAGARISGTGVSATTDSHGLAVLTPTRAGTLVLKASRAGYVRAAPLTVHVG
jgi:hypothetical protein